MTRTSVMKKLSDFRIAEHEVHFIYTGFKLKWLTIAFSIFTECSVNIYFLAAILFLAYKSVLIKTT